MKYNTRNKQYKQNYYNNKQQQTIRNCNQTTTTNNNKSQQTTNQQQTNNTHTSITKAKQEHDEAKEMFNIIALTCSSYSDFLTTRFFES